MWKAQRKVFAMKIEIELWQLVAFIILQPFVAAVISAWMETRRRRKSERNQLDVKLTEQKIKDMIREYEGDEP